jgi:hypothetical protein
MYGEYLDTSIILPLLKKARTVVEWDGTINNLKQIRLNTNSCIEFAASGVLFAINDALDNIIGQSINNVDSIVFMETGEVVLVIYKTNTSEKFIEFKVSGKNEKQEYEWKECPTQYTGVSYFVNHIGKYHYTTSQNHFVDLFQCNLF